MLGIIRQELFSPRKPACACSCVHLNTINTDRLQDSYCQHQIQDLERAVRGSPEHYLLDEIVPYSQ